MPYFFPKSHREARAEAFQRTLSNVRPAALAIDVQAAEIIAANAEGTAALGLFPYASFPLAIDSAMPALQRLREISALDAETDRQETLTFWFAGRQRRLLCRIAKTTAMSEAGIMLVQVLERQAPPDGDEAPAPAEAQPSSEPQAASDIAEAKADVALAEEAKTEATVADAAPEPPKPRSDAETLKEIARRIREGALPLAGHDGRPGDVLRDMLEIVPAGEPAASSPPAAAPPAKDHLPRRATLPALGPDDLARLAHELKTPLAAIAAAAEIMRDERLGPMGNDRYRGYAADIHDSAAHALSVIAAMIRREGEDQDGGGMRESIDLNAIVERVVSTMQPLAGERGLRLAFHGDPSASTVVANATALRQILLNLLTNAIKFTPAGGDVRAATGRLDDGRVFVVVRDTGLGLDVTDDERREASAASAASSRLGAGQGIGLALVRRLVAGMGAEIEIDSAAGKGTVVLIVFGPPPR